MRKCRSALAILAAIAAVGVAGPAATAVVGTDAGVCAAGKSALLVRVDGLKQPTGTLKLSVYGSSASGYLKKAGRLRRIKVPVGGAIGGGGNPVEVCVAVPGPGRYAVAVHHDLNANGDKDRHDGGGYSNNPRVSLARLRPPFAATAVTVGRLPARTTVRLLYVNGLSVGPARRT